MKPSRALRVFAIPLLVLVSVGINAQNLPTTKAEDVGLSSERLARIGTWMQGEVNAKRVPGAVVMVVRQGKVAYYEQVGQQDTVTQRPMARDSLFRIYSMTKPLVSVATMMMVEEGKITLETPIARYIPAFANSKVGVEKVNAATGVTSLELEPVRRPITVQDLLRHTSGLTYGFFGDSLVKKSYLEAGVGVSGDFTNEEFANKLAALPLHYQPGSTWDYSYSTDVLGRVLEVVAGKPLYAVLKERLLDPLDMKDTSFYVTDVAKQARIAEPLPEDRVIGAGATVGDPRVAMKFESGGGGMVSTADDYARFLSMMTSGGVYKGKRFLSPRTIEYMSADHLGSSVATTPLYLPGAGHGFGLGFAVRKVTGESPWITPAGDYWWGGAGGTYFWVDPKSDMFVVFMMQSPKMRTVYRSVLRNMVYAAVEK